jgi:hypothetical protein
MIIISKNIVLSENPLFDPNSPRIGYRTLVTPSSVTAEFEDIQYPARNLGNVSTASKWKSTAAILQYIYISSGINDGVDYVGFANHNLGGAGIAYTVEGSNDGVEWDEISDSVIPDSDAPHMQLFTLAVYAQYRIALAAGTAPPYCAILYLGRSLALQRHIYVGHTPITMGRMTTSKVRNSENGNFLGRTIVREYVATAIDMHNITPAWYRNYFEPFVIAAKTQPWFWAWRPGDYPREIGFVWTQGDIKPTNQRSNGMMKWNAKIQGIGDHISDSGSITDTEDVT